MHVDVIMLSNTKNRDFYAMTRRALESLQASEEDVSFVIHLVETNKKLAKKGFTYPDVDLIVPKERFGYNRFLNHGLDRCRHDWIVVSNNDVVFTKGWFSTLMKVHENHPDVLSLSPWEPKWHRAKALVPEGEYLIGYRTGREVTGWCLVMHRSVVTQCALFDEQFEFWYQDDDYAMTLKKHNIKHALVPGSIVHHEVASSSNDFLWWTNFRMKNIQRVRYVKKWSHELTQDRED